MQGRLITTVVATLTITAGLAGAAEQSPATPDRQEGTPTMSSNARSSAQATAGASARASSSSSAASSSSSGCSAETMASVTRDGKTVTIHRSQRSDGADGCNADAKAGTAD